MAYNISYIEIKAHKYSFNIDKYIDIMQILVYYITQNDTEKVCVENLTRRLL